MKSTRDLFDKELKRRLLNYSEQPERDLWQVIAPRIVSVEPKWIGWSTNLSLVVIAVSVIFFIRDDHQNEQRQFAAQISSGSWQTDKLEVSSFFFGDTLNGDDIVQNKTGVSEGIGFPVNGQRRRFDDLHTDTVGQMAALPIVRTAVALGHRVTIENLEIIAPLRPAVDRISTTMPKHEKMLRSKKGRGAAKTMSVRSFYFAAMPTLGYQRVESNIKDNTLIEGIKRIPAFSRDRLGIRLEAGVEGPILKRWKAFGGILYYQRQQTIGYIERHLDSLIADPAAERPTLEPQFSYLSRSIEYEVRNVGLHVGLSYHLWKNKRIRPPNGKEHSSNEIPGRVRMRFQHEAGTGLELHKSLNSAHQFSRGEGFKDPSVFAFFNLYYRLQYPDKGRLRAIFQPTLNYSFYINDGFNAPFYVKPYAFGLNFGCMYHL